MIAAEGRGQADASPFSESFKQNAKQLFSVGTLLGSQPSVSLLAVRGSKQGYVSLSLLLWHAGVLVVFLRTSSGDSRMCA